MRKHSFKQGSLKAELVAAMRAHRDTENKKPGKIKTSGMDELVAEVRHNLRSHRRRNEAASSMAEKMRDES